jgi:hypothetical protein
MDGKVVECGTRFMVYQAAVWSVDWASYRIPMYNKQIRYVLFCMDLLIVCWPVCNALSVKEQGAPGQHHRAVNTGREVGTLIQCRPLFLIYCTLYG